MTVSYAEQVERSRIQLESMARLVGNAVAGAGECFQTLDAAGAVIIIENDKAINSFEIDIDNSTFQLFARSTGRLPSVLLRKILSIQKVNPMLERIGDHATNIAEAIIILTEDRYSGGDIALDAMSSACVSVLSDTLRSYFAEDAVLAEKVLERDEAIDSMYAAIVASIREAMFAVPERLSFEAGFALFGIGKDLERIADLCMNIAEETLFVTEGAVVKHRHPVGVPAQ